MDCLAAGAGFFVPCWALGAGDPEAVVLFGAALAFEGFDFGGAGASDFPGVGFFAFGGAFACPVARFGAEEGLSAPEFAAGFGLAGALPLLEAVALGLGFFFGDAFTGFDEVSFGFGALFDGPGGPSAVEEVLPRPEGFLFWFFGLGGSFGGLSLEPMLETSAWAPSEVVVSIDDLRPPNDWRFNLGTAPLDVRGGSFGGLPRDVALETSEGGGRALGVDAELPGAREGRFLGVAAGDGRGVSWSAAVCDDCCFFIFE